MLTKLKDGQSLSYDETSNSMENILRGKVSDEDAGKFLNYLREKGESDDELLGMLDKMQAFALHISPKNKGTIIDVCGTGGDNLHTFNISTAAAFVIAGPGGVVAILIRVAGGRDAARAARLDVEDPERQALVGEGEVLGVGRPGELAVEAGACLHLERPQRTVAAGRTHV